MRRGKAKGIRNIFNKIMAENFIKLSKRCSLRYMRTLGLQTEKTRIEPHHGIL
jgi:hypothetical protein